MPLLPVANPARHGAHSEYAASFAPGVRWPKNVRSGSPRPRPVVFQATPLRRQSRFRGVDYGLECPIRIACSARSPATGSRIGRPPGRAWCQARQSRPSFHAGVGGYCTAVQANAGAADRPEPRHQQARLIFHGPPRDDPGTLRLRPSAQGPNRRLAVITQQLHGLVQQLPFVLRARSFITPPQLFQNLFPCRLIHVFIHSGHGNLTSGTTNPFSVPLPPPRVTKLLAQFVSISRNRFGWTG